MAISATDIDDFLKEQFDTSTVQEMQLQSTASALLRLINKDTGFGGEDLKTPVISGDIPSGSADFTIAQSYAGEGLASGAFKIQTSDLAKDYSLCQFEGIMMVTSKTAEHAFFDNVTKVVNSSLKTLNLRTAIGLYRGFDGAFGNLDGAAAIGTTVQMATRGDGRWLSENKRISFRDPALTTIRNAAGVSVAKITHVAVNATNVVLTLDIDVSAWADPPQTGDDVLFAGDNQARATGLGDWVPDTAPGATLFYNVNRSLNIRAYSGQRYNATGKQIMTALIDFQSQVNEFGGGNLAFFIPPEIHRRAKEEIRGSTEYSMAPVKTPALKGDGTKSQTVSVQGFQIDGDAGPIPVYSDPFCPPNKGYLLDLDRFTLHSAGTFPDILRLDGLAMLRLSGADAYEGRAGGYLQMGSDGLGSSGVMTNLGA